MRVRVTEAFAESYSAYNRGQELSVSDSLARQWIARGVAEALDDDADQKQLAVETVRPMSSRRHRRSGREA